MRSDRRACELRLPGLIDSRMLSAIIDGRNAPAMRLFPTKRSSSGFRRAGSGLHRKFASIVAFLASDEASYVSGSAYTVDGGRTAS